MTVNISCDSDIVVAVAVSILLLRGPTSTDIILEDTSNTKYDRVGFYRV